MNIIATGAFVSAFGVIAGAFGTHGLRGKIGYDLLQIYDTANEYLIIHAAALILYGLWHQAQVREQSRGGAPAPKPWPAAAFLVGILIFSGSLYVITFTVIRQFGAITPIGGTLMIAGWLGFGKQALRK